jgi:hypothetical protein
MYTVFGFDSWEKKHDMEKKIDVRNSSIFLISTSDYLCVELEWYLTK